MSGIGDDVRRPEQLGSRPGEQIESRIGSPIHARPDPLHSLASRASLAMNGSVATNSIGTRRSDRFAAR